MTSRTATPAGIIAIAVVCVFVAVTVLATVEHNMLLLALWCLLLVVVAAIAVVAVWRCTPPRRRWWPIPDRWGFRIDALLRWLATNSRN